MTIYHIGEWRFDAQSGELRNGDERRRIEHRAARTLELLAEAQGAIVSQEKIIAEVWNGRTLSDNSVSVVISQLRRVLGDDARRPVLIETVPKRGYRLVAAAADERLGTRRGTRRLGAAAMALMLLVVAVAWHQTRDVATRPVLAVSDVANATGNRAYAPLARATSELVVNQLRQRGFELRRDGRSGDLLVESRLVMWDGEPFLGMTVTDDEGVVRWSAMIRGTAGRLPAGVDAELDKFEAQIATGR